MTQTANVGEALGGVAKHGQAIEECPSFGHGTKITASYAEGFEVVAQRFGGSVDEACALSDELLFSGNGSFSDRLCRLLEVALTEGSC